MTKERLDPDQLAALVKASGVQAPHHVEYGSEYFLIEAAPRDLRQNATPEPEPKHVGPEEILRTWLRNYRKSFSSGTELAAEIGIKRHTLEAFLRGQTGVQPRTLQKIANFKKHHAKNEGHLTERPNG